MSDSARFALHRPEFLDAPVHSNPRPPGADALLSDLILSRTDAIAILAGDKSLQCVYSVCR
jgi:hypothetical protein